MRGAGQGHSYIRHRSHFGSRYKLGLVPAWFQLGSSLVPAWFQLGSRWELGGSSWVQAGWVPAASSWVLQRYALQKPEKPMETHKKPGKPMEAGCSRR